MHGKVFRPAIKIPPRVSESAPCMKCRPRARKTRITPAATVHDAYQNGY